MGRKKKIILPPELPPELLEDEIEVSEEDFQFLTENRDYAGFVSALDTHSITKHVTRVADVKEDALEALYEERLKKKSLDKDKLQEKEVQVDPVDALPVKTLDGQLYYRTVSKKSENAANGDESGVPNKEDKGIVKLTKAERRTKLKKSKKEAKKQAKDDAVKREEVQSNPRTLVLAEVKDDVTAEEAFQRKKCKLAELGMGLLADPEANIRSLKEMLQISKGDDDAIVKLGLLSLLAVFKDIIPSYRIRLPTEKEEEMMVSKAVKKMRFYEATLLSAYKAYLQKLITLEQQSCFQHVAVRCICSLLDSVPHFNFRHTLLASVVNNISSTDDVIRNLCCATINSLFTNEGKHGGEATVEAVSLIADHIKTRDCQSHPDSIEVFLSLSFDEDLRRSEMSSAANNKLKNKKGKKRKNLEETGPESGKKKLKQDLQSKMKEEVDADFKAASFSPDVMEKIKMQSDTLSAMFEIYFRILKHTMHSTAAASGNASANWHNAHPLLAPCLKGLGKFSHLIDMDFMGDLIKHLKILASSCGLLSVTERLRCCIVAFNVMKNNLDALNVDLQEFFIQLYNLILEYTPARDQGQVLAEALKTMLCDGRQHDMQRAAAFIKRLATCSLSFGSPESMAALVTIKHLLQKNVKCRNLLENDAGGGSVCGSIARYDPDSKDPNQSGALASVLWEVNLIMKHYHPSLSAIGSSISSMTSDDKQKQVYMSTISPQQAYGDLSLERDSFILNKNDDIKRMNPNKRKRHLEGEGAAEYDDNVIRNKVGEHFKVVDDIVENEKLTSELNGIRSSLHKYNIYKHLNQNKKNKKKSKDGLRLKQ